MARSGRFEWVTIPQQAIVDQDRKDTTAVCAAGTCPECGWLDCRDRFERLSGRSGVKECWRCGMRWDLTLEVNLFLKNENFHLFSDYKLKDTGQKLIVSYDLAKRRPCLLNRRWDMLVLDEAHRLKNRSTLLYKFVKKIKSRHILALSATPIQNTLDELYSIVDLIQPGRFGTIRTFKRKFVSPNHPREIVSGTEAELKDALSDVMIRNRRDTCNIKFSRRRVGIYYITPSEVESRLYESVSGYVHREFKNDFQRATGMTTHLLSLIILQRELMSTPQAVRQTLIRIARRPNYPTATVSRLLSYAGLAGRITLPSKFQTLNQILTQYKGERLVVFSEFLTSAQCLTSFISAKGFPVFCLTGKVNPAKRSGILAEFRRTDSAVLVSTEAGGVGLNLQCCSHMVNFDLPWNPQRIEQRIGRIDRFGQSKDEVFVFNLVCRDTIEEYVVDILAKKLRMFEVVIGEVNEILGHLSSERSFEQRIANVLLSNSSRRNLNNAFGKLSAEVIEARSSYDRIQRFNSIVNQIGAEA
ncbi:MAG: DEAD/DEAH box helicase [bacterium]|nr:DEAD/DEAH box helicase [bacterium]